MGKKRPYNKYSQTNLIEQNIDTEAKNILDKISQQSLINKEQDIDFDNLIKIFNANQLKKTMQRILKSNELLDKVTEQVANRLANSTDDFTNTDLLNYMKVFQDSINNSQKTLTNQSEQLSKPLIQINQQNINNTMEVSKESQEKIVTVVEELLKVINASSDNILDGEILEVMEGDKNE